MSATVAGNQQQQHPHQEWDINDSNVPRVSSPPPSTPSATRHNRVSECLRVEDVHLPREARLYERERARFRVRPVERFAEVTRATPITRVGYLSPASGSGVRSLVRMGGRSREAGVRAGLRGGEEARLRLGDEEHEQSQRRDTEEELPGRAGVLPGVRTARRRQGSPATGDLR